MYEELYIIDNGKRLRVDLSIPSGITLNFKSNIFGDLSKITCSYTYTFKLPLTANNRRVLDNADDVRCISNKIRRRLRAEYLQDGIPLFANANLYIESTDTCFNAVMTWGVISGFQTLKDDDISIRKLPLEAKPIFGPCNAKIDEYSNTADYVQPLYNAGLTYISDSGWKDQYNTYSVFPLPAIPVYRLIQLINTQYGTKFKLGSEYSYGDTTENHKIISLGVIPCVNVDQQPEGETEKSVLETNIGCYMKGPYAGIEHILTGATNDAAPTDSRFSLVKDGNGFTIGIKVTSDAALSFEVDGCIYAKFTHEPNQYKGQGRVDMGAPDTTGITPKLTFYYTTNGTSAASITSIEGRFSWDNNWCWIFDFSKERGRDRLSINVPPNATVFCAIEAEANALQMSSSTIYKLIRFYEKVDPNNIQWNKPEASAGAIQMDLMSNLPDISCMTLMKALFFMLGAFPSINSAGEIIPVYYTALRDNIIAGNAVDWSQKMTTEYSALPAKMTYSVSGFGQRNFYMMKNDNADGEGGEDETDVYAPGKGIIYVGNEVIDRNKTIIQLPFYAPYIKNKKSPFLATGNTMKFWYHENDEVKTKEAKPCFGTIKPLVQTSSGTPTGVQWMSMEIWNDFVNINSDPSYSYLSRIMENPIIITENLRLNEHDLRNLDYNMPVYLSKYGAFFAVVSITRDSKGISKCELLKLPEEE
ncbi:hypothetical protein D1638_01395 [Muribaculaceae bacterium Z1]|jgi:hypothetical protein|uniref:hypothetical protein n=1 Tax=Duncaniella muris TaxID=2094150 RepID=UPI001369DD61|nr:hypothetical protein [Duncaniella muris]NBH91254.1 hypothetical protein [Muribaculaceae bacterium S4]NBI19578.1 hypothetical protein [Muribaculaceae bacterium Z1]